MNQKRLANIVLIVLVVVLAGALGYVMLVKKSAPVEQPQSNNSQDTQPTTPPSTNNTVSQNGTSGWKSYSDTSLSFEYPVLLSVKKEGEAVVLNHAIDYRHPDPCDFKGDAPPRDKLTDFNVSLKVANKGVKDYIQSSEWPDWDYVSKNPFSFGSFSGFKVSPGVEGCGQDLYYLVISPNKTLVITRPFVSEFLPINSDYQTYLGLPGVIKPSQAEEFFSRILTSLKVK